MATTPTVNVVTFSDFVRLAPIVWEDAIKTVQYDARTSGIFQDGTFAYNSGNTEEFSEFDTNEYAKKKAPGDTAAQSKIQIGYSKIGRTYRVAEDCGIDWETRNQGKYPEAIKRITALARKTASRMEIDLAHRLTFMTATSYTDMDGETVDTTVGDGFQLAYTAHTLKGTSTLYRNRLAGNPQLSRGSLEAMEKQIIENTLNQFGEKMTIDFNILWTTDDPNTINTTRELLQSTASVSAPNAGVLNVYQAKYKHVVLRRVATTATGAVDSTKAKCWGLVSSEASSAYLKVLEEPTMREPSDISLQRALGSTNMEDVSTDTITYSGRACYMICVSGARWIHASTGDLTA